MHSLSRARDLTNVCWNPEGKRETSRGVAVRLSCRITKSFSYYFCTVCMLRGILPIFVFL
jgi:hypothetical protein